MTSPVPETLEEIDENDEKVCDYCGGLSPMLTIRILGQGHPRSSEIYRGNGERGS